MTKIALCRGLVLAFSLLLFWTDEVRANSATWDGGGANGYWTNKVNWSDNNVTWPNADETATFNSTGANQTNLNVEALSAIKYITFDGSGVGSYFVGTSPANSQTLVMRNDGNFRMTVSAGKSQFFNAAIQLGPDKAGASYYFQNDHAVNTLNLLGDVLGSATSGTAGDKTLNVNGIGSTRFLGNVGRGNANNLDINIYSPATTVLSGTNVLRILRLYGGSGSVLDIGAGRIVFTNSNTTSLGGDNLVSTYGGTINGSGSITLTTNPYEDNANNTVDDPNSTLTINCRLTGGVGFEFYSWAGITGTFALNGANDFTGNVFLNVSGTISANKFGNRYATDSGLGAGTRVRFNSNLVGGPKLKYTGVGESCDRQLEFYSHAKLEQAGTGLLNLTGNPVVASSCTLTLMGSTAGAGEISGVVTGALAVVKEGTGTWTLSGTNRFTSGVTVNNGTLRIVNTNSYAGATAVNGGTLALTGAGGAVTNTSGITVGFGGTLLIENSAAANNGNRVRDAASITLNGGTLSFAHTAGDAAYAETLGVVALSSGSSVISASRAAAGKTSTLTLAGLSRTGGSVDFVGADLGATERNRIMISGQAEGLIGPWATVNGASYAAYSATLGVYAAGAAAFAADIPARGPSSVIPDSGATNNVRINTEGESGAIALAALVTTIGGLLQNTAVEATVDTAGKTLRASAVTVPAGKAGVTIGSAPGDGTLAAATAGGGVILANDGSAPLTVNAVIANNTSASSLSKTGSGVVRLAAANTFSGATTVGEGTLVLADSNALQNSTLTVGGAGAPVFDSSVAGHAFTLGALSGTKDLALADNASVPVSLAVGKNNASTTYSGILSGDGSLVKQGNGTLTLSGANTYRGGTSIGAGGKISAASVQALGFGPVANNGTLDLTIAPGTYSGLSVALSGAGTNNVSLNNSHAGSLVYLNGDYSGFTGLWNIGVGAATASSRVQMNGPDNAAAAIVVRTNATLYGSTAARHLAKLTLQGGNTGEANGQLRLDNSCEWAGDILLAGAFTDGNDGFFGATSGNAYLSGLVTDGGNNWPVSKLGGGTLYITGTNNTFGGQLWVRAGWLRTPTMRNLGQPSSLGAPSTFTNGLVKMGSGTTTAGLAYFGSGDTSDRGIDLASTTATIYLDHSGTNLWLMAGAVTNTGAGSKRLQLQGSTVATGELAGVISDYSVSYTNNLWKTGTGTWRLSGNNTFKGNVEVENGQLIIAHNRALGIGPKTAKAANNANNYSPHFHLDGSAGDLTIPADITFLTSNQRQGAIFNEAGNNTILGNINLTSGDGDTILNSVSGKLTIAGAVSAPTDAGRQLRLWGAGDGEISGVISNGLTVALPVIKERGTGTWTLSGSNTYSGITYANNGTLILGGANGSIAGAVDVGAGAAFVVTNSPEANYPNRLSSSVTLNGGTFRFTHPGGAASYSETAGTLSVATGESAVQNARADEGQSSTLTFGSLSHAGGGSVNFVGEGLGEADNRNRILFSTPPVADNGVIGLWALYNGTNLASYTAARGVIAADDSVYANLSAKGPSAVPNNSSAVARILDEGTEGGISLEGATVTSVNGLLQATDWEATVGLTNSQIFKTSGLVIGESKAALTVGTNLTDGLLMPLAAGGGLLLANHSPNVLTINTPVTNNTSASSLVKAGAGAVRLNSPVGYTGGTQINEGDLIFAAGAVTQTLAGVVSGNGNLVKEGSGRLDLSQANTYNGLTVIRGGAVMPKNNASFGSTVGGTVVTNGGTLDVGFSGTDNAVNFGNEVFTVSGAGVDGRGAIINSSARSQYNAFRYVTLAGDTTFGGENGAARWDIRNSDSLFPPYFDMNGYTVTKVGTNYVGLTSVSVLHPGNVDIQQGTFTLEVGTTLGGDANNVMTVEGGALFDIYQMVNPIQWKLAMNDGSRFVSRSGYGIAQNVWAGPVVLNGAARFDANSGTTATLAGDISGAGSLIKVGADLTYITGTNNTYSGGTYVSNNWLYASNPGSLPNFGTPGAVQVAAGAGLRLNSGNGVIGWTAEQLNALHSSGALVASNSILAIDTTYADVNGLGGMNGFALYKYGTNTLTLTGVNTNRAAPSGEHSNLRVYGGTLVLSSSSSNVYGRCYVLPGSGGGTLEINGITKFTESLYVGNGNGDRSRVIVNTNTTAYRAWVGISQIANGALIQNGGLMEVDPSGGGTQIFEIGRDGAYGYYRMNGGTLRTGQFALGGGSGNGTTANNGVFEQFGGAVNITSSTGWLIWGWVGGNGVANLYNGALVAPNANFVSMGHTADRGSFAMLNLLGPGALLHTVTGSTSRAINMANASGNLMSVINLNAGKILANQIYAGSKGTPSFLNFGGGTLLANGGTTAAGTFLQGLTAATVYPGGAVIDSSNNTITVNQPLLAPAGYGVVSIPVANGGSGYIGAPVVMISGGSGTGATAIATVDLATNSLTYGQVTGITVTSPGSGYQANDALTVTLLRGGYTATAQTAAPVLAANLASGGLTKLGSGVLTLGGTNTYGGSTVINSGTLKLGNAKALPTGIEVVLAGGTLDLNGFTVTNALSVISGTVSNGAIRAVISPAGAGAIGDETITLKSATLQGEYLADVSPDGGCDHVTFQGPIDLGGLKFTVVDPDLLDRNLTYTVVTAAQGTGLPIATNLRDKRWRLKNTDSGDVKLDFVEISYLFLR